MEIWARAEAMLTTQAHTLDAIFNNLARRAINAEYMDNLEKYLRLGLRAQSQCRATLEALAEMKSPRQTAFVNQANIAHGHQQINNTLQQPSKSAKENEIVKNELLEKTNGERMDVGTAGATGRVDRTVEAVGESQPDLGLPGVRRLLQGTLTRAGSGKCSAS